MSLVILFSLLVAASGSHAALKRIKGRNLMQNEDSPLCVIANAENTGPLCGVSESAFNQAVPAYVDIYNAAIFKAMTCVRADNGATTGNACSADAEVYCKSINFEGTPYCVVDGVDPTGTADELYSVRDTFDMCEPELRDGLLSSTADGGVEQLPTPECVSLGRQLHNGGCVGDCEYLQTLYNDVHAACSLQTVPACSAQGSSNARSLICEQHLFATTLTCPV